MLRRIERSSLDQVTVGFTDKHRSALVSGRQVPERTGLGSGIHKSQLILVRNHRDCMIKKHRGKIL